MRIASRFLCANAFYYTYAKSYNPMMITAPDIENFFTRTGVNQEQLAKMVGVTQPTVSRWLKGSVPGAEHQEKLQAIFETVGEPQQGSFRPAPKFFDESRDLPVFSAAEGGKGEMVVSTAEPIELVPRPWYLKDVKDGYAVYVTGDSMEPRYFAGELLVVNPKSTLVRMKDAIITTAKEGGDFRAMVKMYMGASQDSWKLRQFNPPPGEKLDFSVPKREWPFALRVVGRYDGG